MKNKRHILIIRLIIRDIIESTKWFTLSLCILDLATEINIQEGVGINAAMCFFIFLLASSISVVLAPWLRPR